LAGGGQRIAPHISSIMIHAICVVLAIGLEESIIAGPLKSLVIQAQDIQVRQND